MNETQLAVWTKGVLADHSVNFVDEEDNVTHYEVGGDHAKLASDIFNAYDCTLTVEKDGVVFGGMSFTDEYCNRERAVLIELSGFSMTCEHLIKDLV